MIMMMMMMQSVECLNIYIKHYYFNTIYIEASFVLLHDNIHKKEVYYYSSTSRYIPMAIMMYVNISIDPSNQLLR